MDEQVAKKQNKTKHIFMLGFFVLSALGAASFLLLGGVNFASAKNFTIFNAANVNLPYFSVNGTTGFVGVGVTNPGRKLDVNGSALISGDFAITTNDARFSLYRSTGINYFDWASGQPLYFSTETDVNGASRSTKMSILSSGNVGIGTTTPLDLLSIGPQTTTGSNLGTGHNSTPTYLSTDTYALANIGYVQTVADGINNNSLWSGTKNVAIWNGTSGAGNVGIGTTNPGGALHVVGGANKILFSSTSNSYGQMQLGNPGGKESSMAYVGNLTAFGSPPTSSSGSSFVWNQGVGLYSALGSQYGLANGAYGGLSFLADSNGGFSLGAYAKNWTVPPTNGMIISGSVGIGTTGPNANAKLDVVGNTYIHSGALYIDTLRGYTGNTWALGDGNNNFSFNLLTKNVGFINGNVGIGTTTPLDLLSIGPQTTVGSNLGTGHNSTPTYLSTDSYALANIGYVQSAIIASNNSWNLNGNTVGVLKNLGTIDSYDLPFITANTEKMRITTGGYVGIGTTNPHDPLHVTGILRVGPFYSDSDRDQIELVPNGTDTRIRSLNERFHIENTGGPLILQGSSGNVGIGTTNPALAKLQVNATALGDNALLSLSTLDGTYNPRVVISHVTATNNQYVKFDSNYSTGTDHADWVFMNGNVGIGTTGPKDNFSIGGAAGTAAPLGSDKTGHNYTMGYLSTDDYALVNYGIAKSLIAATTTSLWSGTKDNTIWNGTSGAGNVGIGTSNPGGKLDVAGTIENGLVLWLPMDEASGTNTADYSINSYNGTLLPAGSIATRITGKFNKGLLFDGINNWVQLSSTFIMPSPSTLSVWVKTTSAASNKGIFGNCSGGPAYLGYGLNSGKMEYRYYDTAWVSKYSTATVNDGKWHLLTWVKDSNTSLRMYIDGILDSTQVINMGAGAAMNSVGSLWGTCDTPSYSNVFAGSLDDLRVYNRALSKRELAELYGQQAPTLAQGGTITNDFLFEGNVGIGTTAPYTSFDVKRTNDVPFAGTGYRVATFSSTAAVNSDLPGIHLGYDTTGGGIIAPATQSGTTNFLGFWTYNGSWSEKMRIAKDGSVGIGTTGPKDNFSIGGAAGTAAPAGADKTGHNYTMGYLSTDDYALVNYGLLQSSIAPILPGGSESLWAGTSTSHIWNRNSGNVGIGTTNPQSKLQIWGSGAPVQADPAGTQNILVLTREGSPDVWREGASFALGRWKTGGGSNPFSRLDINLKQIADNSSLPDVTVMSLQDNGNVGIGTTAPVGQLEVTGNTNWSSGWKTGIVSASSDYPTFRLRATGSGKTSFIGNDNDGGLWFGVNGSDSSYGNSNYGMVILPSGNVGIGTVAPKGLLQLGNDLTATTLWTQNNTYAAKQWNTINEATTDGRNGISGLTLHNNNTTDGNWSRLTFSTFEGTGGNNIAGAMIATQFTDRSVSAWGRGDLAFFTNDHAGLVERMRILDNGNVGIGTTGPKDNFSIGGAAGTAAPLGSDKTGHNYTMGYLSTDDYALVNYGIVKSLIAATTTSLWSGTKDNTIWNGTAGAGNVGIGTSNPRAKLEVNGTATLGGVTTWGSIAGLAHADVVAGKMVLLTLPSSNFQGTVKVYTSRDANDVSYPNYAVATFKIARTGGATGAYAGFYVTEAQIDTTLVVFNWYFDTTSGNAYLRFGQSGNSYNFYVVTELTSGVSPISLVVDSGTSPTGLAVAPQYTFTALSAGGLGITGGNVGIGTTNPTLAKLQVNGNIYATNVGAESTDPLILSLTGDTAFAWASEAIAPNMTAGHNVAHFIGQAKSAKNSASFGFKYAGSGSNANLVTIGMYGADNLVNINGLGNVGIGTTGPKDNFSIGGAAGTAAPAGADKTGHNYTMGYLSTDDYALVNYGLLQSTVEPILPGGSESLWAGTSTSHIWNRNSGNVGIGTTNPIYKLDVNGPVNIVNGYSDPSAETGYRLKFVDNGGIANDSGIGLSGALGSENLWINKGSANGNIRFMFGTLGEKVTFTSAGSVGIGVTNPTTLLQITNNGWISALNAAGTGAVNMFKVNANNQIEVGAPLNIGSFEFSPDSGLVTFADMPVSSAPANGTPEGYAFKVDGDNVLSIYSEADGAGGVKNKRVGIGTINPLDTLSIGAQPSVGSAVGTGHNSTATYISTDSYALANINYVQTVANGITNSSLWSGAKNGPIWNGDAGVGNVGIGTTGPSYKLDVAGSARMERHIGINSLALNSYATINPASNVFLYSQPNDRDSWLYLDSGDTSSNWGIYHRQIDSAVLGLPGNSIGFVGGGSSALQAYINLLDGSAYFKGNVGIGTTNPLTKFQVVSTSGDASTAGIMTFDSNSGTADMGVKLGAVAGAGTAGYSFVQSKHTNVANDGNLILNPLAGNVGIGTIAPNVKFDVLSGSANSAGDSLNVPTAAITGSNVELPTTAGGVANALFMVNTNNSPAVDIGGSIGFGGRWNGTAQATFAVIKGAKDDAAGTYGGYMAFGTRAMGTQITEKMRITGSGKIGIGTTAPNDILSISDSGVPAPAGSAGTGHNYSAGYLASDNYALVNVNYLSTRLGTTSDVVGFLPLGGGTMSGDINMGGGDSAITNLANLTVGKITATTIDPLYTINNTSYSTFAPSIAGGVKEEFVGKADIKRFNSKLNEYEYIINFDLEDEGSDLWLWHKVIDYSDDNVQVFMTPSGKFVPTYYVIEGNKLIFRADSPVKISYRLIGNRYDWRNWPTRALDQNQKGVIIK